MGNFLSQLHGRHQFPFLLQNSEFYWPFGLLFDSRNSIVSPGVLVKLLFIVTSYGWVGANSIITLSGVLLCQLNLDFSLSHHQYQQLSILGRRISPISCSCLWCSTRPGRTSACRGFYRSCACQPFQTCAREESDPTSPGTFFQTLSARPHPCSFPRCPCNSLVITESHTSGDVINIWLL